MTFTRPSIPTCAAHLVLAGVSGWSLKQLPAGSNLTATPSSVPFMSMLLIFLLVHSLLGIFRHSHPDPHANLRKLYDLSALLTMLCPLPLLNTQLYLKYQPLFTSTSFLPLVYGYLLVSILVPFTTGFIYSSINQRHKSGYVTTAMNLVSLLILTWISCSYDNLWGLGLAVSYCLKLFALPRFAERYSIVDLYIYGLAFFEIFAINVVIDAELYRVEMGIR
uniref:Putative conserved plasma membrane protein n=1 Tax=Culex tarsalis TaxID=7177 RepID=A0A1Q3FAU8_CULTA